MSGPAGKWMQVAEVLTPPIPDEAVKAVAPGLDLLEAKLAEQVEKLPIDTLLWTPRDSR